MKEFPHHYAVTAAGEPEGDITLDAPRLPRIISATPPEFDGPGHRWSPEALLVASVADCFVLTFRAIARLSNLPWISLTCDVTGTLDRVDRVTQFTEFRVHASLTVPEGTDDARARQVLARAEQHCLITNSMRAARRLEIEVHMMAPVS